MVDTKKAEKPATTPVAEEKNPNNATGGKDTALVVESTNGNAQAASDAMAPVVPHMNESANADGEPTDTDLQIAFTEAGRGLVGLRAVYTLNR